MERDVILALIVVIVLFATYWISIRLDKQEIVLQQKIKDLELTIESQNLKIDSLQLRYIEKKEILINMKDEKEYIPDATPTEQYNYLSDYKYEPY